MASSNIKLFDENKGNMLTDTEFNISTQRLNGLQTGVASSQLQNKAMYQVSLVAYAIAQIMMQNGKNANDTDAVSAFVANLSGTMLQKVYDLATAEEAKAGIATGKWMSPALVKAAIDTLAAKAQNILSDTTKTLYGLGTDAVPDDVFQKLAMPNGYYGFDVTTALSDGTPVPNVLLNGLQDISGNTAMTDENGRCSVAMADSKTPTVTISNYIGVIDTETTVTAEDGVVFTPVTITLEMDTSMHLIQTSQTLRVLPGFPVDMCIVGGGAGGVQDGDGRKLHYGGGGGYVKNILNTVLSSPFVSLTVGAGGGVATGNTNTEGPAGGSTSITYDGKTETVSGGQGATGNGNSILGANATDGTVHVFEDSSLPLPGGGGSSSSATANAYYEPGKDFGARGAGTNPNGYVTIITASGPGGGGGGGSAAGTTIRGTGGAAGGLYIRVKNPTR